MKKRKFRRLSVETFERRQLLAVDLGLEDVGSSLAAESFWNGPDPNGVTQQGPFGDEQRLGAFESGGLSFNNLYSITYDSWAGWAYSNTTDTTTAGYANQHSAFAGGGAGGSSSYAVGYQGGLQPAIELTNSTLGGNLESLLITNSTYTALSMLQGDQFARRFGWLDRNGDGDHDDAGDVTGAHPDWLLLTIEGLDAGDQTLGTVDFYLADYRFADDSQDYVIDQWTDVDISSLNGATKLTFTMTSSDSGQLGMNTPGYFALDRIDIGLEDVGSQLNPETSFYGPDPNGTPGTDPFGNDIIEGTFESGGLDFSNTYTPAFGSWSGWAFTNETDTTTPGFANQASAYAGTGAHGSDHYATAFSGGGTSTSITLTDAVASQQFQSLMVTNTTYAAVSMLQGDAFARRFGWFDSDGNGDFTGPNDHAGTYPDWFMLTIEGRDATGGSVGAADVYLADFRFDNSNDDYVLEQWTEVDLTSLRGATSLEFAMSSSDVGNFGMNTPAYFSVDNIHLEPTPVVSINLNHGISEPDDLPSGPQPTSWETQRSLLKTIDVTFREPMNWNSVGPTELTLVNHGIHGDQSPGIPIPLAPSQLTPISANTLRIQFADIDANGPELPDGVYALTVDSSATDATGNSLAADFSFVGNSENRFYQLQGEWNGDAGVSVFDFSTFSYWFGAALPEAPGYVDLNGDAGISVFDFSGFSGNFGESIQYPLGLLSFRSTRPAEVQKARADLITEEARQTDLALQELLLEWT